MIYTQHANYKQKIQFSSNFMIISNSSSTFPIFIDNYRVHQLIGQGSQAKVYLCSNHQSTALVSIKVYEKESPSHAYENQVKYLQKISHQNIINLIAHNPKSMIKYHNNEYETRRIIILQFAHYGELFNIINVKPGLSERTSKYIFLQILKVLKYLQQLNIAHRDIKLENILFDQYFNIKVIDFGLATELSKVIDNEKQSENYQTQYYKPPEIYKSQYSCQKLDIFAAGFMLFCILFDKAPFQSTKYSCKEYLYIRNGSYDDFWKFHLKDKKRKSPLFNNPEFKSMMNSMLHSNPENRATYEQLMQNQWLMNEVASHQEAISELKEKFQHLNTIYNERRIFYENLHKLMDDMKLESYSFGRKQQRAEQIDDIMIQEMAFN